MNGATVVFDLDGTMIDTGPDLTAALNHVLRGLDLPEAAPEDVRPVVGLGARAIIECALAGRGHACDGSTVEAHLKTFLEFYRQNIAVHSRPFPGFEDALAGLAAEGFRLAVCTNKREELAVKLLKEMRLAQHFHAIAGGDTFAVRKPDPGHLLGAITAAGGVAERAVMVGDSRPDVAAARAAGVPVIAVSFGYAGEPTGCLQPDLIIHHFDELREGVATLLARA
jgi:phosphoglycolate phosphatase